VHRGKSCLDKELCDYTGHDAGMACGLLWQPVRTAFLYRKEHRTGGHALSQYLYNLQDTIPGHAVAAEWQNLVAQQAHALDVMLRSLHTNLNTLRGQPELPAQRKMAQLQTLVQATGKGLGTLAHKLVGVEQQLAQIMRPGTAPKELPQEHVALVQTLEQVISALHANLTTARQALLSMVEDSMSGLAPSTD
jgi:hypothetical protein